jgi:tetratricopeptide (TPR) repeat protein
METVMTGGGLQREGRNRLELSVKAMLGRSKVVVLRLLVLMIIAYLALFAFVSLTRTRNFSPDSMNYVDVGRNIAAGRGIVQSALGYNEPRLDPDREIPAPLTVQPPLYPLMIAFLIRLGVPAADAALLIAALAYAAVLIATYLLGRACFTEEAGLLAVACLLVYYPMTYVASYAWSDPLAIALMLTCFLLLALARSNRIPRAGFAAAGFFAGLAFLTRYALLTAFFVGLLPLVERGKPGHTLRNIALYSASFGVVAVPLAVRNLTIAGSVFGLAQNPSVTGFFANLRDATTALFGGYFEASGLDPLGQAALLAMLLVVCVVILVIQHRSTSTGEVALPPGTAHLVLWPAVYTVFLLYQATRTNLDPIGGRLIAPAGIVAVLLFAALVVRSSGRYASLVAFLVLLLALAGMARVAGAAAGPQAPTVPQQIAASPRLTWVAQNTTDQDLIIGDYTYDVPFFLGRSAVVSFSHFPFSDWPEYSLLDSWVQRHCAQYRRIYLVLRSGHTAASRQAWYGPFIADIVTGTAWHYPDITFRSEVAGVRVFEWRCGASGRPEDAEPHFKSAIEQAPDNPEGYYYYARWLGEQSRIAEARAAVGRALALSPNHAAAQQLALYLQSAELHDSLIRDSLTYYRAGDYQESIRASQAALEVKPGSAVAYNNICAANNELKQWNQAIEACQQALVIDPNFVLARNNLNAALKSKP